MFKLIFRIFIFCFSLYICFWLLKNLDFDSVFTKTAESFKYEFSLENIKNSSERLLEIINSK